MKWLAIAAVAVLGMLVAWRLLRSPEDEPASSGPERVMANVIEIGPARVPTTALVTPAATLRLEGQVIDEADQPVADAQVAIMGEERYATTDAGGSFVFEGLQADSYTLVAATDRLVSQPVIAQLTATSEPVTIRVVTAGTVVVKVIAEAGEQPIAGATVMDLSGRKTTTDTEGIATIRGVGPRFTEVYAWAPGYARGRAATSIDAGADKPARLTIALSRGAPVSGTVVGPDGQPVAAGHVYFRGDLDARFDTYADATGAWKLDAVPAGTYQVKAMSETFAAAPEMAVEVDGVTPKTGVVVRVELGAQLVGTVVDATKQPVAGARVTFERPGWSSSETTDRAGRFAMLGTPTGAFTISARTDRQASREMTVELVDKQRTEVVLEVVESSIAGRVVDGTGAPIAGAHVVANPAETESRMTGEDVTNSKGEFDLRGVPPGDYQVRARDSNAKSGSYGAPVSVKSNNRDVTIVIDGGATVTGRVLLDGKPVAYYGVVISAPDTVRWRQLRPTPVRAPDGRFAQREVPAGKRHVVIAGPGFARKVIENVDVKERGVTDLGDIAVERGASIRGRVLDGTGAPVAGATVTLEEQGPVRIRGASELVGAVTGVLTAVTDAAGAYQLDGIPPAFDDPRFGGRRPNRIGAHHDRGVAPQRDVAEGNQTIDLVLLATGAIDGTLVGARKYDWVQARPLTGDAELIMGEIRSKKFTFDKLPAGEYTLHPTRNGGRGFPPPPVRVTVVAGKRTKVTITLPDVVTLTVRAPAKCEIVVIAAPGSAGDPLAHARCDGRDFAEIEDVVPGQYRACVDTTCTPITVTPSPARQTVSVTGS